jgi:polyisoprenoid-binding protein YceI
MILRSILASALLTSAALLSAKADNYKIDPVHSIVLFKVGHLGIGNIYGRFDSVSGDFVFDSADPTKDSVDVKINTDSVDTNAAARDKDLKSPDFLNAKQFPTATFKSTAVKKVDDKDYDVTGDFTLRGITEPIVLAVKVIGTGPGPKGEPRLGTESTVTLKRTDFDMKYLVPAIPDEVQLTIAVEGIKQ